MTTVRVSAPAAEAHNPVEGFQEVVSFPHGLPGFTDCHGFVLFAAETANFQWLTAVDGPPASFLTVDPRHVAPTMKCNLTPRDMERLQATAETPLLWLAIVLVEADGTVCVNLRAPIVINPAAMIGFQIMPERSLWPVRHVIARGA
jgi:flagellar assembly factor FliW